MKEISVPYSSYREIVLVLRTSLYALLLSGRSVDCLLVWQPLQQATDPSVWIGRYF